MANHTTAPDADAFGHCAGCQQYGRDGSRSRPVGSHADLFCNCHDWREPRILAGGTNVAWPAGWIQEEADAWRAQNNLSRPQTWLQETSPTGAVRLSSINPEIQDRAHRAEDGGVETFVYWAGQELKTVVGAARDLHGDGAILRFRVVPEPPGAHALQLGS